MINLSNKSTIQGLGEDDYILNSTVRVTIEGDKGNDIICGFNSTSRLVIAGD